MCDVGSRMCGVGCVVQVVSTAWTARSAQRPAVGRLGGGESNASVEIRVTSRTERVIVGLMNVTGLSITATARATSSPVAAA